MISALSPFSYGEVWELSIMHQNYSSLEPKMTQLQGFKVLGGVRDFKVPIAGSGLIKLVIFSIVNSYILFYSRVCHIYLLKKYQNSRFFGLF